MINPSLYATIISPQSGVAISGTYAVNDNRTPLQFVVKSTGEENVQNYDKFYNKSCQFSIYEGVGKLTFGFGVSFIKSVIFQLIDQRRVPVA